MTRDNGSLRGVVPGGSHDFDSSHARRSSATRAAEARRRSARDSHRKTLPEKLGDGHDETCPTARFISVRSQQTLGNNTITRQLEKAHIFKECTFNFLEGLAYHMEEKVFDTGTDIITQGELGSCMYLLNFGQVGVLVDGRQVAELDSGTLFGEMAVLSSNAAAAKRTATIKASATCLCWVIDRPLLLKVLAAFPKDAAIITAEAKRRLQDLKDRGLVGEKHRQRRWSMEGKTLAPTVMDRRGSLKTKLSAIKVLATQSGLSFGALVGASEPSSPFLPQLSAHQPRPSTVPTLPLTTSSTLAELDKDETPHGLHYEAAQALVLPNFIIEANGEKVPLKGLMTQAPRKTWAVGETEKVARVRSSAMDFLVKRGQLFN